MSTTAVGKSLHLAHCSDAHFSYFSFFVFFFSSGILKPLSKDQELKVMFVDVGHSSTQAALVSFTEGKLQVLATAADRHLGGRDFDDVLVQHFKKYILDKYKMDVVREQRRQKTKHNGC